MTSTASGLVLGLFLSTAYGAAFHLIMGGPPRKIALYTIAAWIGFIVGHFVGAWFGISLFKLGTIHLFSASIGAWIAIVASWFLGLERQD